ncbi:MAG: arginyltransferase [Alphaproteobacteria bacterium]|nr:arginyltransferase [Alphaproteobacteria bacterium]
MPEGRTDQVQGVIRKATRPRITTALAPLHHFFATSVLPCPYVEGRFERKLVVELCGCDAPAFYNDLSRAGFRRSHSLAYRPACAGCASCVPVRIPVADFVESRSLRRIRNLNRDLGASVTTARADHDQFRLFQRYQHSRHAESDMAAMSYGDYRAMVEDTPLTTALVRLRDRAGDGALRGACLTDLLDDGVSAVYSFYDPAEAKRGLGTLLILSLVDEARRRRLPFVYLGYWIAESPKMAYKARFRPLEALRPEGWQRIFS